MQRIETQLIARLRVGSVLTTRKGASYRVVEPVMQVAPNGRVVPSLVVERTTGGRTPQSVLISIGILTNLMRHGARHKPGRGAPIDWPQVPRRIITQETTVLGRRLTGG